MGKVLVVMRKPGAMISLTGLSHHIGGLLQLMLNLSSLKNVNYESREVVSNARSSLHDLENVRSVLEGLSTSLEGAITDIKKHISLVRVSCSFPFDVLSEIFQYAEERSRNHNTTTKETLSLVCRQFRHVVLNTPHIWTSIRSADNMPFVRACLQRSGVCGLSIRLSVENKMQMLAFLAAVKPHAPRWKSLTVILNIKKKVEGRHHIMERLMYLHLPLLRTFTLFYEDFFTWSFPPPVSDSKPFYKSWTMPNLCSFEVDIMPRSSFAAPNLTILDVDRIDMAKGPAERDRLRELLTTFPGLEVLTIGFAPGHRMVLDEEYDKLPLIEMPNLEVLIINARECDPSHVCPVIGVFRAPKLRSLTITTKDPEDETEREDLLYNFFPPVGFPMLKRLSLLILAPMEQPVFFLPFESCPQLRSLTINTPAALVPFSMTHTGAIPPLQDLELIVGSREVHKHIEWLAELQTSMKKQNHWEGFESLEVFSAMDDIEELYGGDNRVVIGRCQFCV